jgi:hypothetical protein
VATSSEPALPRLDRAYAGCPDTAGSQKARLLPPLTPEYRVPKVSTPKRAVSTPRTRFVSTPGPWHTDRQYPGHTGSQYPWHTSRQYPGQYSRHTGCQYPWHTGRQYPRSVPRKHGPSVITPGTRAESTRSSEARFPCGTSARAHPHASPAAMRGLVDVPSPSQLRDPKCA